MDNIKSITNEELNFFVLAGKAYLNTAPRSKLWYAVDKLTKIGIKMLKKVEREKDAKRREFALTLDKGVYDTKDNNEFKYNVEGHKKLVDALNVIDESQIDFPIHIVSEYDNDPKIISFDIRRAFEGIVIPEITDPYEENEETKE